jgi:hypothetical protein
MKLICSAGHEFDSNNMSQRISYGDDRLRVGGRCPALLAYDRLSGSRYCGRLLREKKENNQTGKGDVRNMTRGTEYRRNMTRGTEYRSKRKIDGNVYEHLAFSFNKKQAVSDADIFRHTWKSVRVLKCPQDGYDVWGRGLIRR